MAASPTPHTDPAEMQSAVAERDAAYDGVFVYAVTSTGIYCRPSCPSRRPRPDRVRFFGTPAEAASAGFRPCLRCQPDAPVATLGEQQAVAAAAYIETHAEQPITLAELAAKVGASPSHLQRTFTRVYGQSPRQYQATLRVEGLKRRLKAGEPVATAGYDAGFGSSRGLYEHAGRRLGMSPATYRNGGRGLTIRYTVVLSELGQVLVGHTERGVCTVLLADDETSLATSLAEEFPQAALERDDTASEWTQAVVEHVAGRSRPDVPLDLQGTDFQRRVWAALQRLPAGATVSYSQLAESIGRPAAVRAVASACAGNHVAIVVPCHRVIRQDGGLGGYKWGIERKRQLLERESADGAPKPK